MKTLVLIVILLFSVQFHAQKGVYDQQGKRIYYSEDSDKKHEVTLSDGRKAMYTERILFDHQGDSYFYDHINEQVIKDDTVVLIYNFNRRRWEWVEPAGLAPGKYGKKEDIKRIYERIENEYTTPDQGEYPILTFKIVDYKDDLGNNSQKVDYIDEFGHTVFSRKGGGSYPQWMTMTMMHNYYQKNYLDPDFMTRLTKRRNFVADSLANTNALAIDILQLGKDYETNKTTFMGDNFEMIYFSEIEGTVKILNEDQIKKIKNDWLILNPETYRRTAPYDIPKGAFYVPKKKAKKRGIQGINGRSIVFEVKIKPESIAEFMTVISQ